MLLRRFTDEGLAAFEDWLNHVQQNGYGDPPSELLLDYSNARVLTPEIDAEERVFDTRIEWASYANELLKPLPAHQQDKNFWAWLSLAYFDSVCPPDRDGYRKVRARARYIPEGNDYRRYYRHLLASPYAIFRAHSDDPLKALCLLASSLSSPGELVEQLAARQELVSNKSVVHAATLLYIEGDGGAKRGAGGSGPGSPRRLAEVLDQFDLTYDVYSIPPQELIRILPKEFDRFKS